MAAAEPHRLQQELSPAPGLARRPRLRPAWVRVLPPPPGAGAAAGSPLLLLPGPQHLTEQRHQDEAARAQPRHPGHQIPSWKGPGALASPSKEEVLGWELQPWPRLLLGPPKCPRKPPSLFKGVSLVEEAAPSLLPQSRGGFWAPRARGEGRAVLPSTSVVASGPRCTSVCPRGPPRGLPSSPGHRALLAARGLPRLLPPSPGVLGTRSRLPCVLVGPEEPLPRAGGGSGVCFCFCGA